MARSIQLLLCILLLLVVFQPAARADVIVLSHGGTLKGRIVKEDEQRVVIQVTGMGSMSVERSRIREIRRAGGEPTKVSRPTNLPKEPPGRSAAPPPEAPVGPAKDVLDSYRKGLPRGDELGYEHLREHASRLRTIGSDATEELGHYLRHSNDWRIRLLAVRALRLTADPEAIPVLVHALDDSFYGDVFLQRMGVIGRAGYAIRHEATEALAVLGPTGHAALLEMAQDREHPEQDRAVRGLVRVKVPGRVRVLIALASDRDQRAPVRGEAVDGLTLETEGAQEALAALLADESLRDRVETALVRSRDRIAIDPLFLHVRKAAVNCELARRAAETIATIDDHWRPTKVQDTVDYLLFSTDLSKIKRELSDQAVPRLKHWASSRSVPMRMAAKEALAAYQIRAPVRRTSPSPPQPRPVKRG